MRARLVLQELESGRECLQEVVAAHRSRVLPGGTTAPVDRAQGVCLWSGRQRILGCLREGSGQAEGAHFSGRTHSRRRGSEREILRQEGRREGYWLVERTIQGDGVPGGRSRSLHRIPQGPMKAG